MLGFDSRLELMGTDVAVGGGGRKAVRDIIASEVQVCRSAFGPCRLPAECIRLPYSARVGRRLPVRWTIAKAAVAWQREFAVLSNRFWPIGYDNIGAA